jgi:hypothetical protein
MGIYALRDSDMQHLEFCFYSRIQAASSKRQFLGEESLGFPLAVERSMLACCVNLQV